MKNALMMPFLARSTALWIVVLAACSAPMARPPAHAAVAGEPTRPVADLRFQDPELDSISVKYVREAQARGIVEIAGRTRADRLMALESALGNRSTARDRIDALAAEMIGRDVSQWAGLRAGALREFHGRADEAGLRVGDLIDRWQRQRFEAAMDYISSNYTTLYVPSIEWERRFHDFIRATPRDATTWGWLVLYEESPNVESQYGRADAETAYRYYLEFSGLGTAGEARDLFSVPGIALDAAVPHRQSVPNAGGSAAIGSQWPRKPRG